MTGTLAGILDRDAGECTFEKQQIFQRSGFSPACIRFERRIAARLDQPQNCNLRTFHVVVAPTPPVSRLDHSPLANEKPIPCFPRHETERMALVEDEISRLCVAPLSDYGAHQFGTGCANVLGPFVVSSSYGIKKEYDHKHRRKCISHGTGPHHRARHCAELANSPGARNGAGTCLSAQVVRNESCLFAGPGHDSLPYGGCCIEQATRQRATCLTSGGKGTTTASPAQRVPSGLTARSQLREAGFDFGEFGLDGSHRPEQADHIVHRGVEAGFGIAGYWLVMNQRESPLIDSRCVRWRLRPVFLLKHFRDASQLCGSLSGRKSSGSTR